MTTANKINNTGSTQEKAKSRPGGGEKTLVIVTAQKKKFLGFTLIELLIVIAILGILAAAVLVAINPGKRTRQAQDAKRKNDIGALATELQGYYTSPGQGTYPATLSVLTAQGYLKTMPLDPTANIAYSYSTSAGATEAAVWATLAEPNAATANLWCWSSTSGQAKEAGACSP